jgi:hypothetical protein
MNRLDTELHRLYLPHDAAAGDASTRALVLEVTGPGRWQALGAAWRGVQADLGWPAPAIAVSGRDGLQLWFSLASPVPVARTSAALQALCARYLAAVPPRQIRSTPASAADSVATALPPREVAPGRWSAFVAPDLAALFEDEGWLDLPPGPEAQADLLARLQCLAPADLEAVLPPAEAPPSGVSAAPAPANDDPRRFLLQVMNDPSVDLRLRIEAAKALLPLQGGGRTG